MCDNINEYLERVDLEGIEQLAQKITNFQSGYLERNKPFLQDLAKKYSLGIISNFSGNLEIILKEFQMLDLFSFVLDSYHQKVTKPDAKIFKTAIEKTGVGAEQICYMGDNPTCDMIPAKKLGMRTIYIFNPQESRIKRKECQADVVVESLLEIKSYLG